MVEQSRMLEPGAMGFLYHGRYALSMRMLQFWKNKKSIAIENMDNFDKSRIAEDFL